MKHFTSLIIALSYVVCMTIATLIVVQRADAHYNVKTVTNVREHCWLVGFPSRTFCATNNYKETKLELSRNDHKAILNPANNLIIFVHKQGHAGHDQEDKGPYRKTTQRLVYDDCGECN